MEFLRWLGEDNNGLTLALMFLALCWGVSWIIKSVRNRSDDDDV